MPQQILGTESEHWLGFYPVRYKEKLNRSKSYCKKLYRGDSRTFRFYGGIVKKNNAVKNRGKKITHDRVLYFIRLLLLNKLLSFFLFFFFEKFNGAKINGRFKRILRLPDRELFRRAVMMYKNFSYIFISFPVVSRSREKHKIYGTRQRFIFDENPRRKQGEKKNTKILQILGWVRCCRRE